MGYVKLVFFMLYPFLCQLDFSSSSPYLCPEDQVLSLLQFKHMFTINPNASAVCDFSHPKTLSWNKSTNCCSWDGVYCDGMTRQVIEINLTCSQLQGTFHPNSSLFQLSNLKRLGLSGNDFSASNISPKFGGFSNLTHLDLSYSSFTGLIPSEISHLSKLRVLNIRSYYPYGLRFGPQNFGLLLRNLTQLRDLQLDSVNISSTVPLNFSSYLTTLRLPYTQLVGVFPKGVFHLSDLVSLDLTYNPQLTVRFPTTKWNSSASLINLRLSRMNFTGEIPESFGYLTSLYALDMSYSNLSGPIPKPLSNLTHIQTLILDFSSNFLTGPIPSNVSGLQNLQWLILSSNHLNGTIPSWIFTLSSLTDLDLSDNNFSGKIQEFKSKTLSYVTLKQNQLEGPIPKSFLNQQSLEVLLLSLNNLSGQISSTICNLKTLAGLDLGNNNLKGMIPRCLGEMSAVRVLDLSNNNLSGTTKTTFSIGNQLSVIKLHGNKLEGKVPRSLINCKYLEVLDLGNNELNDTFPKWLGTLPNLKIVSLRSNQLHGHIKVSKNKNLFAQLQILDVSSNGFSGNLPASLFENFQAMRINDPNVRTPGYVGDTFTIYYEYVIAITTKGRDLESVRVFPKNIIINLSNNRFEGYIPSIVGDLVGLRTLNLSHNRLEGHIPASLQHLSVLESLDLSSNKIGGGIPQQLASLTFLAVLNLSHNQLVGCIPKGKQFDTFERSSYQGNDGLRGFPLPKDCGGDDGVSQRTTPVELDQGEGEDSTMISWQAILMGYGCGLVVVLSLIYIMLATQYPAWFSRMIEELEHKIITRVKKHKRRK
ncbi:receptor-like protein 9DC3 [Solanum stenotomum]|uniref:receptor-like protein 9DC3 n=1 Tax=Solanum stenotomum TaxID=172797 RepID=UPI0020D0D12A|nr:receptor-like protein 9DC3 [Solanum stenotomum]